MAVADYTLKDYQASILAKLEQAKKTDVSTTHTYLGVRLAGNNVLVSMQDISETLPIAELYPVPLVKPWFLGVTNIRGILYSVYDLAQLLTGVKTGLSTSSRALLVHDDIASHIAIMVESVKGIRKIENMRKSERAVGFEFCMQAEVYEDESGEAWQVLDCAKLLTAKQFVQSYL